MRLRCFAIGKNSCGEGPEVGFSGQRELLFAISFTTQTSMRTLSAGLLYMVGQYEVQWGPLSAGVILSTVPVAVLFSFLQRHLIHGLTAGAVKG
jgi:multiple sugar transport system permease protein